MINSYKWQPKCITCDFSFANLNAINKVFNNNALVIVPCLFHLLQAYWRKASNLGLRKKKFLNEAKVLIFNLELLCFMNIKTATEHYSNILKYIEHNDKIDEFLEYFENIWFPVQEGDNTKFEFNLWNYANKFQFKAIRSI